MPGTSLTIVRSSPTRRLKSDDLPTFGRPRIATRIASSPTGTRELSGRRSTISSSRSPTLVPCWPEMRHRVAEAEAVQVERQALLRRVVDLVREQQHLLLRAAQQLGELLVAGRDAGARVDDEQHEVGLGDRGARLLGDLRRDVAAVGEVDAARVDQHELLAVPLADELLAVARRALRRVDDGRARAGQPVDQRRLADVREADDRDRPFHSRGGTRPGLRPRRWTSASQS